MVDEDVKGLRIRKSGLLVGDRHLLNNLFKEERFNGWIQGEVIVMDDEIIPNARRDDFEKNDAYMFLVDKLKKTTETISDEIRNASRQRNIKASDKQENTNQINIVETGKQNTLNNNNEAIKPEVSNSKKEVDRPETSNLNNTVNRPEVLNTNEVISKIDYLISKVAVKESTLIENVCNIINQELDLRKAESIIEKIKKMADNGSEAEKFNY